MTTYQFQDTQALDLTAVTDFCTAATGLVDIWLETQDTADKPERVTLLNHPLFVFPDRKEYQVTNGTVDNWQDYLDHQLYRNIGTPHNLFITIDDSAEAIEFEKLLAATSTKATVFIDLPEFTKPDGDPLAVHDWIVANAKGRVIVWLTYHSYRHYWTDMTTGEEFEEIRRWLHEHDTHLLGTYDHADLSAFPSDPTAGITGSNVGYADPELFIRMMFREPNDAMLFRLSWGEHAVSEQPENAENF
ncbi:hypothetical protein AX777_05955 [Sphingobium yanoikuyae]|uniref:Uncharacterized protein n=1 Tax=Sphingobium yanoikuyae TaxID=13690 RepID=A0A177JQX2_SPHYA|nr:hypothetical protein [Sphingobium yanoikuyae]OAH42781.1 hypothetical protein AX777_05955 [Sphingobium yanoikuyae]